MDEITEENVRDIIDQDEYLLFYFTAKWCGPCQRIKPLLEKISEGVDKSKLKIYMIDIDENDKIAEEFNIKSVPTFYLYKTKKLVGQTGGGDIKKVQGLLKLME